MIKSIIFTFSMLLALNLNANCIKVLNKILTPKVNRFIIKTIERGSKFLGDKNRSGKIVGLKGQTGNVLGKKLGSGIFGEVYHYNSLVKNQNNLMIKIPHQSIIPIYGWRNALIREINEQRIVANLMGQGADARKILKEEKHGKIPYIIKVESTGHDLLKFINTSNDNSEVLAQLEKNIFNKAKEIYEIYDISVDIRPSNLYWDTEKNKILFYEYTTIPNYLGIPLYYSNSFKNYLDLVLITNKN